MQLGRAATIESMHKTIWLARLLLERGPLTQTEILQAWCEENARNAPMARSTFFDNLRRLRQEFGIEVVLCDSGYSLASSSADNQLIEHLTGFSAEAKRLSPTAQAIRMWRPIIADALEQKLCIQMTYRSPSRGTYETLLAPYCLHTVGDLTYVVGRSSRHRECRTFALDRIQYLKLTPSHFKIPKDFSEEAYFYNSLGAYAGPCYQPAEVVLRATPTLAAYFRSRPLHNSQREMSEGVFSFHIAITRDLVARLLSFGPDLVVCRPESLVVEMRSQLRETLRNYSSTNV